MRNASHRFWPCIAAAVAVAVIAVPAAAAGVRKYDTEVTIAKDGFGQHEVLVHGSVISEGKKCELARRWVLFKARPGADRKLYAGLSAYSGGSDAAWGAGVPKVFLHRGVRLYAKVRRKSGHGYVCRADRSETLTRPEA